MLRSPVDGSTVTWRPLEEKMPSFWPGRLDWVAYSDGLEPLQGLLLDAPRMSKQELRGRKLIEDDSRASDHLMLIGDFGVK